MRSGELVVVLCAGACIACTFHGASTGTPDAADPGDGGTVDAAVVVDADPGVTCAVHAMPPGVVRGRLGGSGGGTPRTALECSPTDVMVGVALLVSDGVAGGPQERSAQGIRIACAPVTIAVPPVVGTISTVEEQGDGGAGWAPSQWTPMTTCPAGSVIAGMSVHSGQYDAAFINASILCRELDNRAQEVATVPVYVAGSLDEPLDPHEVSCDPGEVLVSATPFTGAGLDSVRLSCEVPQCAE